MNSDKNSSKITLLIAGLVAFVVYIYVILRAYYVPPFCDEVITFFDFIRSGDMQPFYARTDANNHVLNSALSRVSYLLFGDGIFVLRIPNLLVFGVFLGYLFKFRIFFNNQWIWLAFFVTLVVPQYFLDFFHLSRGYGLSMAFLMATLFHVQYFDKKASVVHFGLSCLWISLAVWSNLSLTLTAFFIGAWLVYSWLIKQRSSISFATHAIQLLLFSALFFLPVLYAVYFGFELKNAGMLYYGADNGFWDKSIIMTAKWIAGDLILGGVLVINSLFVYLWLIASNFKTRKEARIIGLHLVLFGNIAAIVLMHHLLDVKYPVDRATNHLFLMFFCLLFFEIDRSNTKPAKYFAGALALFLVYNTIANANLSLTRLWATEHVPFKYFKKMVDWKKEHGRSPSVTAHGIHQIVLKYYDFTYKGNLNLLDQPGYPNGLYDFVLIREDNHRPDSARYETVFYDEKAQSGLFQLSYNLNWTERTVIDEPTSSTGKEFISLAVFDVQEFRGRALLVSTSFLASCSTELKKLQLIYAVKDDKWNDLTYYQTSLDNTYEILVDTTPISSACVIENIPQEAKDVVVYLWNVNTIPITVSDGHSTLYTTDK